MLRTELRASFGNVYWVVGSKQPSGATMSDVARRAGVSVTTVSHVLNATRPVADATMRRVMAAASELGYVLDDLALGGRGKPLGAIGLAMSAVSNPYFSTVVQGVDQALSAAGYSILLAETHDDATGEAQAISQLLRKRVDGVILAPVRQSDEMIRLVGDRGIPVVAIDRGIDAEVDQTSVESTESTAKLVDHLAQLGHRRIAMIRGREGLSTTAERDQGFRLGLRRNGLEEFPQYLVNGNSNSEAAADAFAGLIRLDDPPTALVVGNNIMTVGVLTAAKRLRVNIPDDIALTCFDDLEWAGLITPGLTAIAQPVKSLGMQAAELVMSRLADPTLPIRRVVLHPTFVHRESCGCPPPSSDRPAAKAANTSFRLSRR